LEKRPSVMSITMVLFDYCHDWWPQIWLKPITTFSPCACFQFNTPSFLLFIMFQFGYKVIVDFIGHPTNQFFVSDLLIFHDLPSYSTTQILGIKYLSFISRNRMKQLLQLHLIPWSLISQSILPNHVQAKINYKKIHTQLSRVKNLNFIKLQKVMLPYPWKSTSYKNWQNAKENHEVECDIGGEWKHSTCNI
jgi:hypothetical protein